MPRRVVYLADKGNFRDKVFMFCFLYKRPKQHQQSRHKYKHAQKRVKYSLDKTYAHVRAYLELHKQHCRKTAYRCQGACAYLRDGFGQRSL